MENSVIYTCLKRGDFLLSSGRKSKYLFDVMELVRNDKFMDEYFGFVRDTKKDFIVGIEFGGAILASVDAGYQRPFAIIRKDGTIYGSPIPKNYILLDDVVTTENSLRTAIEQIGHYPSKIKCIVDRRKEEYKSLHIESMMKFNEE